MARVAAPLHRYAAPLRRWLRWRGHVVVASRPPEALEMLLLGLVDAAVAPLAAVLRRTRSLRICSMAPMVYSVGETGSSILVSRGPRRLWECGSIAATWETVTSLAYLEASLERLGLRLRLHRVPGAYTWQPLLARAPCALLLGDEALRARSQGLSVVADTGLLLWETHRAPAVYAVTVARRGEPCPEGLRGPPWPRATMGDAVATARETGLSPGEALEYHRRIRLDYNASALLEAVSVLRSTGTLREPAQAAEEPLQSV